MSGAALAERPQRLFVDPPPRVGSTGVGRPHGSSNGGRLTLEQRLDGVWEGLHAEGVAECPLCRGRMARGAGAGAATCADCGASMN
jgi:hypothetical protein